jgi:hypothetical protein
MKLAMVVVMTSHHELHYDIGLSCVLLRGYIYIYTKRERERERERERDGLL